jgi:hypothetical protein
MVICPLQRYQAEVRNVLLLARLTAFFSAVGDRLEEAVCHFKAGTSCTAYQQSGR